MGCSKCGGYLEKKDYIRKTEREKGWDDVYECRSCGHRTNSVR